MKKLVIMLIGIVLVVVLSGGCDNNDPAQEPLQCYKALDNFYGHHCVLVDDYGQELDYGEALEECRDLVIAGRPSCNDQIQYLLQCFNNVGFGEDCVSCLEETNNLINCINLI